MKRSLISQMKNEWRSNMSMIAGLTLLCVAIWYFTSTIFSTIRYYNIPMGFDDTDVMVLDFVRLSQDSPEFTDPGGDLNTAYDNDLRAVLRRVRESPYVEAAGFSIGGNPYVGGRGGDWLIIDGSDTLLYKPEHRLISPEVVKVLRLQSLNGESVETLQKRLEDGELLISNIYGGRADEKTSNGEDAVGKFATRYKILEGPEDSYDPLMKVGGLIHFIRGYRYYLPWKGNMIQKLEESGSLENVTQIMLRVKPGMENKFREEFDSSPEMRRYRNISLYDPQSLQDIGYIQNHDKDMEVRLYCVVIVFLLIVVFLGLFGTFWFRVERRTGEIAIRRVCGASRWAVFRRVIGEGLVLFIFAAVFSAIIGWIAIFKLHLEDQFMYKEIYWPEVISLAAVCIGIILSVMGPAYIAMQTEPAVAIKDE